MATGARMKAMSKAILAIDPGQKGAFAWIGTDGVCHFENMPGTPYEILELVRRVKAESAVEVCYLEDVGYGMPGQSSSATAKFARHNGHLEMALMAEGIRIVRLTPQKWERSLGFGLSKGFTKVEWKRKLKQRSQELYPQFKVTLTNSDALLLLEAGRRYENK